MSAATTTAATTCCRAAAPTELGEDRRGHEHGEDGEEGLPADRDQPAHHTGDLLPLHPERGAGEIIVGAEPRLPAMAMMPTRRKETMTPMTVTTAACQNEIPNPRTNAA